MELEIQKMLVLSTGHITEKDMRQLERPSPDGAYPYTTLSTPYGAIVVAPEDMVIPAKSNTEKFILDQPNIPWVNSFSDQFIEILRLAKNNKCTYINFDCDGPEIEGFRVFNW